MIHMLLIMLSIAVCLILALALRGVIPKKNAVILLSIVLATALAAAVMVLFDFRDSKNLPLDTAAEQYMTESHNELLQTETAESAVYTGTSAAASDETTVTSDSNTAVNVTEAEADTEPAVTASPAVTDTPSTTEVKTEITSASEPVTAVTEPVTDESDNTEEISEAAEIIEETETAEVPDPDFAAMAEEAYSRIVYSAAANILVSPMGRGHVSFPFERVDTYSALTEAQKGYYDELSEAAEAFTVPVYRADEANLEDVRAAMSALHTARPDIECYFSLTERSSDVLSVKFFRPSDGTDVTDGDKSGIISDMAYLDAVCDYIVENIPENATTYDKYRYLASVITLTTEYDMEYEHPYNNATAYGGIIGGKTICVGYSVGFEYLCARADLYCARVEGVTYAENIHMWNLAKLESGTYYVDVTWSDNGVNKPSTKGWMKYFMLTQDALLEDHIISDGTVATGT